MSTGNRADAAMPSCGQVRQGVEGALADGAAALEAQGAPLAAAIVAQIGYDPLSCCVLGRHAAVTSSISNRGIDGSHAVGVLAASLCRDHGSTLSPC